MIKWYKYAMTINDKNAEQTNKIIANIEQRIGTKIMKKYNNNDKMTKEETTTATPKKQQLQQQKQ